MSICLQMRRKTKMVLEKEILRCENGEYFYKNFQPFLDIVETLLPGQIIRVYNYGTTADREPHYVLGTEGKLYDIFSQKIVNPKKVLSKKSAPDGWSFEGCGFGFLPDDEIRKVVES